ncbi:hypothetical protein KNW02_06935 [Paracoccus sp. XHP0099]|uniref:O-antigen ligase like membrane protein n=2 Tax=Paracoccus marinaquae TaxID=2841926 RepID=A0ABS6AH67_9RHOB|nr:hypothetical protein [Paracoccus marinaquae]
MPNSLAYLMLTLWPAVTLAMYLWMPPRSAVIWSILAGYMLLPAATTLDLPGLPGLNKYSIPSLFGYVYASLILGRIIPLFPETRLGRIFCVMLLLAPFLTVATNRDLIFVTRDNVLPALRLYDAVSVLLGQLGTLCIWALARDILSDARALRQVVTAIVVAFLWYSVPMLYEVRMSPQLHIMIYGFFQHDFMQMMRQGGFRPIVFLEHGLLVAILTAMSAMLAVVLARSAPREDANRWYLAAAYLLVVLVLCKSMAALVYAIFLMPMLLILSPRRLMQIAMGMGVVILSYPILRTLDVIPTDWMAEMAGRMSADRAQSLQFRFDNEDALLAHAMQRPLFGWGGWARAVVHDPVTGQDISVADGLWVISMGYGGFFSFIAQFGLLLLPVFLLGRAHRAAGREVGILAAGVSLVLALNMVDLLPNASITPVTWLISGSLLGYLEALRRAAPDADQAQAGSVPVARKRAAFAGLVGVPSHGPRSLL